MNPNLAYYPQRADVLADGSDPATQIELDAGLAGKAQTLVATAVKTAPYTASPKDYVLTDATAGSVVHPLPTAPPDGTRIGYKMVATSGSNTVTFACGGSDHINLPTGPTSGTLRLPDQAAILQYAAATAVWTVQSNDLPLSQLDARYVPGDPVLAITYNADGTVASVTEAGITTTYTYNADGTVATSTRLGVTRTYGYTGSNLTSVA